MTKFLIALALLFSAAESALAASDSCAIDRLCWIKISSLRPSQFAVGFAEVKFRKAEYEELSETELKAKLKKKFAPAVRGPKGEIFITDRHHLAFILTEMGRTNMFVKIVEDWSGKSVADFEKHMIARSFTYLFDENDELREFSELPKRIRDLKDDPYRSVVYFGQKEECIPESDVLFAEFKWAHFLRDYIAPSLIKKSMKRAIERACEVAASDDAKDAGLPGTR